MDSELDSRSLLAGSEFLFKSPMIGVKEKVIMCSDRQILGILFTLSWGVSPLLLSPVGESFSSIYLFRLGGNRPVATESVMILAARDQRGGRGDCTWLGC